MRVELARRRDTRAFLIVLASALALCVLSVDILTNLHGAVAVLYIAPILTVARTDDRRAVTAAGLLCALLTLLGWLFMHWGQRFDDATLRLVVSLTAIGITTILSIRNNRSRELLSEQARILELTHDTVIIRSVDDTIIYWNEGAEKLYGWTRSEAIGRRIDDLLATIAQDGTGQHLQQDGKWSGEISRLHKDGHRIPLASRWLQRFDRDGRPNGVIETSADLTAAKREADERRRSEERYRSIFNAAGFPIWETDLSCLLDTFTSPDAGRLDDPVKIATQATVQNANDAAAALFGLTSRRDLIGLSPVPFYPSDQRGALQAIWAGLFDGKSPVEQETTILTATGESADVLLRVTLPEGEDPWKRVLVMAVDVTERNRAQARLAQAQAELTHMMRVTTLGQLTATIAHEVNQPLSAIITYGRSGQRWLKREAESAPEVESCLDHIVANGVRAAEVINRVRSLARKSEPQHADLDVPQLLTETLTLLQRNLHRHQIGISTNAPAVVPKVRGDHVQIQQVLMNLLLNAEQAMVGNIAEDRAICLDVAIEDGFVQIEVRDCGSGIEGDPEMLFRPFFTTKADGMGMGLPICRSIVEQHGGTLTARNLADGGAAFRFSLPIVAQAEGMAA